MRRSNAALDQQADAARALGRLLGPLTSVYEEGRREITINGKTIIERMMSDGSSRVYVQGMKVDMGYADCMRHLAGGAK